MTWACLDDGFHDDHRGIEAGLAAVGIYTRMTCYVSRHLLDGVLPKAVLGRLLDDGDMAPIDALMRVGLVEESDDGAAYALPDYFKHGNVPRAEVERRRRNGKRGAVKRWSKSG